MKNCEVSNGKEAEWKKKKKKQGGSMKSSDKPTAAPGRRCYQRSNTTGSDMWSAGKGNQTDIDSFGGCPEKHVHPIRSPRGTYQGHVLLVCSQACCAGYYFPPIEKKKRSTINSRVSSVVFNLMRVRVQQFYKLLVSNCRDNGVTPWCSTTTLIRHTLKKKGNSFVELNYCFPNFTT